jgi:hypothetical protein
MASGFIILNDGRCWSRRWTAHDRVLEFVIEELGPKPTEREFKEWLQYRIPAKGDIEMGYAFIKQDSDENIVRVLDLRELTPENQKSLWAALQKAYTKLVTGAGEQNEHLNIILRRLLKMRRLAQANDNPDNFSDWVKGYVKPPSGKKSGPGW